MANAESSERGAMARMSLRQLGGRKRQLAPGRHEEVEDMAEPVVVGLENALRKHPGSDNRDYRILGEIRISS